ncbi:hypothetical protein PF008_g5803 [Phytophthora fragariae]|uniref:Uncharacterized protein n=1 Tax=Phytophthora fragariae TaxID=53985 RepID=A0A6G0S7A3_9STRA|nr:hypothetical protein PF008_g5803 [Phytophthora fragariae]
MMRSAKDVSMGGESKHEDEEEMDDVVPPMAAGFSTPRRRQQTSDNFEFSVTPEPSRRRLSSSRGRQPPVGLEESPARYSPSKVKAAVRSFADFLHFLEQEEHQQEHTLMPVIIQRFAELGAVIESQKRHIDRWKGKELDLAIEEAQQNLELIRELGETIQKQELQIASDKVEKQQWEEKYHLAAQEVESLKKQGTYQIQQLRSEVAMLRQAGVDVETKLKEREAAFDSLQKSNETLKSQLQKMEQDSSVVVQENTTLKQREVHQSEEMRTLERQIDELREHYESVASKATELERNVATWQAKYEEKERQVGQLEDALHHGRQEMGQREGNLERLIAENRKLQEHADRMAQEHEKQLADQHKYRSEVEAEHQKLSQALQQESTRFQKLKKEAGEVRAQIEAQAMSAMKQREQQLLDEKSRVEEELQQQFSKINQENIELRAKVESLKDINRRKSTEIGRLMASSQEAEQQQQSRNAEAKKMQQFTEEVTRAKQQLEALSKELAAKDAAHAEAMKSQSTEFENQYNDFVAQVEEQFNELTRENEQLRADIDEAANKLQVYEGQSLAGGEELSKWRMECEKLQHQLLEGTRENDSLKREIEHRLQEIEAKNKENAELNAHIEQFLSPDNERTREVELLQRERVRLEEQNRELQGQIETIRVEADARLNEAQQIHSRYLEEKTAHENTVRSLCEEKEEMNRTMLVLSSEKSTLEFQVTSVRAEVEHWKAAVQQLENDKRELELRIQEVMRQATEQIESQKQSAAMTTEDGRTQLQKLTAQLVQRDTQMSEGHQQLRTLQDTVRSLEDKLRAQQYDYESLQMKNEQLTIEIESLHNEKHELELIMRQHRSSLLRADQPVGDISLRLGQMPHEMDQRVQEESDKANHLQAVLDSQLDAEQQRLTDEKRELEEEISRLQRQHEENAVEFEKLDSDFLHLQHGREEQERAIEEMQQTISAHEESKWRQGAVNEDIKRLEAERKELEATHQKFKTDIMAQLKEKDNKMADLEDDISELQSKLDQEKEMTRHLMDRSNAEKLEHADGLSKDQTRVRELEASLKRLQRRLEVSEQSVTEKKEQQARVGELEALVKELQCRLEASEQSVTEKMEQQARVEELEASVKRLQHKLQVSEQSVAGKEQNAMHEKLQKEREYRSLQARYDDLAAENVATLKKMDAKVEEVKHLHQEIDQLREEIEQLHEEIRDNTAEMDNARSHLHVSEQLTTKLEEMQDELAAREEESRHHESELAAKEEELQRARDAEQELKRHLEEKMNEKEDEVASLQEQNTKFREQLKRMAQTKLSSKQSTEADAAARETKMKELEEAYEQSVQKEQELTSQIAQLEDAKSAMLNQFRREMRKLNIEFGTQSSSGDGGNVDESAFHRGIMEVSYLLRSYQDRETRQDALIHRKEKQINDLKAQLDELEHSLPLHDDEMKKHEEQLQRERERSFHQQIENMSEEVSKLELENRELRENPSIDTNGEASAEVVREWEDKCAKLQHRVRELKEANSKLKESRFSKADMKALVKEVENLTSQMLEKDMQLQALRKREASRLKSSTTSAGATGSRRSKDLLIALQEKEDKIMVLNDHLTGLMTENMRLQHSTEQYVVQYGPLDDATTNGVIGNSGIRVPRKRQQATVRSQ